MEGGDRPEARSPAGGRRWRLGGVLDEIAGEAVGGREDKVVGEAEAARGETDESSAKRDMAWR